MYFSRIALYNFGIYKGAHEMRLTDKVGNRNVTLIGGLNGRGKTTLHDAALLAMYGKQALKYIQENARSDSCLTTSIKTRRSRKPMWK